MGVKDLEGRELDVRVQVEVFGYSENLVDVGVPNGPRFRSASGVRGWRSVPHYSKSIADAWKVVEQIECIEHERPSGGTSEPGYEFSLLARQGDGHWLALFAEKIDATGAGRVWEAFGRTAPEAICRAALRVVR